MDEEQQRERADPISRTFALITMKLEDATGIAADSQGQIKQPPVNPARFRSPGRLPFAILWSRVTDHDRHSAGAGFLKPR